MILELAILNVRKGMESEFEITFARASAIIASIGGYISHELQRCIEVPNQYLLLVRWQTLEDHTTGFRNSPKYEQWKRLLHHFYEPFPKVEHFEKVFAVSLQLTVAHSSSSNSSFPAPHTGHTQSSGISSNAVPGAMSFSGSPTSGSYS